ncbi:MAG: uroporphyrinogen decarboxylase [Firmicutes bacterium]|nr:uroporphyrinogen decarboxylase [Bacillota bacterium]
MWYGRWGGARELNDVFLRVCRGRADGRVPVWFMRQAGRYQPEYRELRRRHSLLDICRQPSLCATVTKLPVEQLGVDAAILFSDIMVPLEPMGVRFEIREGVGPVVAEPLRDARAVAALRTLEPERDVPFVLETVERLKAELDVPLIGFSGAPFTLASYLVEGGPSRDQRETKKLMYGRPDVWHALLSTLTGAMAAYLTAQVRAGAAAVQVFDSWAGALAPRDYDRYVRPHMERLFEALRPLGVPRILFSANGGALLERFGAVGADVVSVDWRVPLDVARRRLGGVPLQGNLDPVALLAPWDEIARQVEAILAEGSGGPHIFNLGHGVLPETDPAVLKRVVELVHGKGSG